MTILALVCIALIVIGCVRLARRDIGVGVALILVGILLYPGGSLILR